MTEIFGWNQTDTASHKANITGIKANRKIYWSFYNLEIGEFSKLPQRINVCLPKLIQKPIDRKKLYNFFREITSLTTDTKGDVLSRNNFGVRELLHEPELVATIHTDWVKKHTQCKLSKWKQNNNEWICQWY